MTRQSDSENNQAYFFIRDAVSHILQIAADVVHVGVAEEDPGKVLLADGGQASRVGEELNLQHLCLQVVHEPARRRRRKRKRAGGDGGGERGEEKKE